MAKKGETTMKKPHTLNITVDWAEYVRLSKRLKDKGTSFSKWVREQIDKELGKE